MEATTQGVQIISPADGEVLERGAVTVRLQVEGLVVVPAGVEQSSSGHHHLIVDAPLPDLGLRRTSIHFTNATFALKFFPSFRAWITYTPLATDAPRASVPSQVNSWVWNSPACRVRTSSPRRL